MKRLLFIVVLLLQFFFIFANRPIKRSPVTDSLITELQTLPHDTTRLKLLEKLVLTEQNSPHYIEYAEEMFNEAQRQKMLNTSAAVPILKFYITIIKRK